MEPDPSNWILPRRLMATLENLTGGRGQATCPEMVGWTGGCGEEKAVQLKNFHGLTSHPWGHHPWAMGPTWGAHVHVEEHARYPLWRFEPGGLFLY